MSRMLRLIRNTISSMQAWIIVHVVEGFVRKPQMNNLYLSLGGHIFFKILNCGVQFDLFSLLDENHPMNLGELAKKLGIEEYPAKVLLLGCVSLGLLKKEGELYSNTHIARKFLSRKSSKNIIDIVAWQAQINYLPMSYFYDSVKSGSNVGLSHLPGTGETLYERLTTCRNSKTPSKGPCKTYHANAMNYCPSTPIFRISRQLWT